MRLQRDWKTIFPGLLAILFLLVAFGNNVLGQISIVTSKSSTRTAGEEDLKAYFAGIKFQWPDGSKIAIADQPDSPLAESFYTNFVGRSVTQVRKQWTKLLLSGQADAPVKCANDEEVKKFVTGNPNAVGYIASSAVDGTVKELLKTQ